MGIYPLQYTRGVRRFASQLLQVRPASLAAATHTRATPVLSFVCGFFFSSFVFFLSHHAHYLVDGSPSVDGIARFASKGFPNHAEIAARCLPRHLVAIYSIYVSMKAVHSPWRDGRVSTVLSRHLPGYPSIYIHATNMATAFLFPPCPAQ